MDTHDFSACRVLVVEPHVPIRRILRDMLVNLGVGGIEECSTPAKAIEHVAAGRCTVVFVDWSEDFDAAALIQFLRGPESPNRYIPVVVMSAFADARHVTLGRDSGMTEFMVKPFSGEILASRLKAITLQPRPFVASDRFFGPDRRRRRAAIDGPERRRRPWQGFADRRTRKGAFKGPDRRQTKVDFVHPDCDAPDRRGLGRRPNGQA